MAFEEILAERIRDALARKERVKKMFGGVGFLLNGNMLVGVWKNSLIARHGEILVVIFPTFPCPTVAAKEEAN
jgi:TfoX/Sxy family transcriptional regulator of competence genes